MKIVVNALLGSVSAIFNVGIVIMMIWIMFAILAISFMKNEMGYCEGPRDYYGISEIACQQLGFQWATWPWNFDNIGNAFVTLFVLSSLEGWPNIMLSSFDAAPATVGPSYDANIVFGSIYFIFFILIGSLFLMNLFVGVIFFQFQTEKEREKKGRFQFVNDDQLKWIQMQGLIQNASPEYDLSEPPENKARLFVYEIVTSYNFERYMLLCIILNIVDMGMRYDGMTLEYEAILKWINFVFTLIFILEAVFKIFGQGFQYFYSSWH